MSLIIGEAEVKIDSKNRFSIPQFTQMNPKDAVIIERSTILLSFKIYLADTYKSLLQRYQNLALNASTLEEFTKYNKEIEDICNKIVRIITIDNARRILLPNFFIKEIDLNPGDTLKLKGLGNYLLALKK